MQEQLVLLFAVCLSLSSGLPQRIQATDPPVPVWPTVGVDMQRDWTQRTWILSRSLAVSDVLLDFRSAAIGTDGTVYIGSTDTFVYALNGRLVNPAGGLQLLET